MGELGVHIRIDKREVRVKNNNNTNLEYHSAQLRR